MDIKSRDELSGFNASEKRGGSNRQENDEAHESATKRKERIEEQNLPELMPNL